MLDGQETEEIACGELRWEGALLGEGARQHAGRRGNRANSLRRGSPGGSETACWTEETVQIACGELRSEGARKHARRRGNHANSLGRALLGASGTACWTERKPCK